MHSFSKTILSALVLLACGKTEPANQIEMLRLERTIPAHTAVPRELAFSPDSKTLATSSVDRTIKLWDVETGKLRTVLRNPSELASLAYSPDGQLLATGGYDGAVRIWRVADSSLTRTLTGHTATVWSVAFSPDGQRIASSGEDKTIRLWRVADGSEIKAMTGHTLNVWSVDFSSDGKFLGSGSFDHSVRLWDPNTGAALRVLGEHEQAVVGIAFSTDGKTLATSGDDNTIRLWDAESGRMIRRIESGNHTYKIAFSPDGQFLVSAGRARSALGTLWHSVTGGRLSGRGEALKVWRASDGALLQIATAQSHDVWSIATSPDGRWVANASDDNTVKLWRFLNGRISSGN
jgi:WD40 repeat protein